MKNKLIQLAIFTLLSITLNAQITWEKVVLPDSVLDPVGIVELDENTLIVSSEQGIYKSIDDGINWYVVSNNYTGDITYNRGLNNNK